MSKKLKTLLVVFDNEIKAYEIPAFRGAIIKKVGFENMLFHNHKEDGSVIYQYPFIQYKEIYGKPAIYCIDDGVDEIHKVFSQRDWSMGVGDRRLNLKIDKLDLRQIDVQVWQKQFKYKIRQWVALNTENFSKYRLLESAEQKKLFLAQILKGNILSMAKGIEWTIDKPMNLEIEKITREGNAILKKVRVSTFDLVFNSNVFLPDHIGLGKSVTLGYGCVRPYRDKIIENEDVERA
ncbi:MAG: hypothetical protein IPO63_17595 [Bacteroidetes bacterium]|nr:hypothetical protein [Bacteroidota bacterium]